MVSGGLFAGAIGSVRGTGTQYLKTGLVPDGTTEIAVKYKMTALPDADYKGYVFGEWGNLGRLQFAHLADSLGFFGYGTTYSNKVPLDSDLNWHMIEYRLAHDGDAQGFYLDGAYFSIDSSYIVEFAGDTNKSFAKWGGTPASLNLYVCSANDVDSQVATCRSKLDIASCKITKGGVVVRDLFAWQKDDGTICFKNLAYDGTAAKGAEYYGSASADAFVEGSGLAPSNKVVAVATDKCTFVPAEQWVMVGSNATLTAVAKPGYGFLSWTKVPSGATKDGATITFPVTGPVSNDQFAVSMSTVVYVKPGGTGDGSSWANAMGDPREAVIKAVTNDAPRVVKLAKGIHKWSGELYVGRDNPTYGGKKAFTIQGGFAGESEGEVADNTVNPTYISLDKNGDDRWVKRSFSKLRDTGSSTKTDCGLIVDGGNVVWPDDSEDEDALYAPDENKVSDNVAFLKLNDNDATTMSDVTFLGAGPTTFMVTTGCSGIYLKNVTFLGSCVKTATALGGFSNPTGGKLCNNVKVLWTYASQSLWGVGGQSKREFRGFHVKGLYYSAGSNGGIFTCGGDGVGTDTTFADSTFEKCYASQTSGYKAQAMILGCEKGWQMLVTNCVFRNLCSRGNDVAAAISFRTTPAGGFARDRVVDCLFENCSSYAEANSGEINNYGLVALASEADSIEGCTFRNNTCTVKPTKSATIARAGIVTLTTSKSSADTAKIHRLVVNCTFASNTVEAVSGSNDAETTPRHFSRSVLVASLQYDTPLDVVVADCTFAGTNSVLPDVVWTGLDKACSVKIQNSLFNGPASKGYVPVASENDNILSVDHSLLNGCTALPSGISGANNIFIDIPLGDWDDLGGTRAAPVLRPDVRFESLRTAAYLGSFKDSSATYLTDENGKHIYKSCKVAVPTTVAPLRDALGEARPDGNATIGAVQGVTAKAENGASLVLTASPVEAGTFTGGGTIQVVEKGAGVKEVTAVSTDPKYTFVGWKKSDGTTYSTSATLTIDALNEDLQLTAEFSAPKVNYTFDLGRAGTFDESGDSSVTLTESVGSDLVIPAYTIDTNNFTIGTWDPVPPAKFGDSSQTFTYKCVEKVHRIVRVDLNLEEGGTGVTWATAMTDIQAAIDKAAQWTGEVWIRQGVHSFATKTGDKLVMANNVAILGGFEGEDGQYDDVDAERAARDPEKYRSVITADIDGDDVWSKNGSWTKQTVVTNGVLTFPAFAAGSVYGTGANKANADYIFYNGQPLDDTAILDGVTLVSAATKALYNGDTAVPAVRNCTFISTGVKSATYLSPSNCTFLAVYNQAALWFTGAKGVIRDCTFRHCHAGWDKGVFAFSDTNMRYEMYDTTFDNCTGGTAGFNKYLAAVIGTEHGSCVWDGVIVRNCWAGSSFLVMPTGAGATVRNCLFENNRMSMSGTNELPYAIFRPANVGGFSMYNTTFRNNKVTRSVGDATSHAAIVDAPGDALIVNCTFGDNTVACEGTSSNTTARAGVVMATGSVRCSLVHAAFSGNVAKDGDLALVGRSGTAKSYVVNSVFADDAKQGCFSCTGDGAQAVFYNNVAVNLKTGDTGIALADGNQVTPVRLMHAWQGVEPVLGRRAAGTLPAMDAGRNVYLDKGVICVPTDAEETAFINAATGAAVTPSGEKQMLDDVLGMPRPAGHVTAGSVQALGSATMMLVR